MPWLVHSILSAAALGSVSDGMGVQVVAGYMDGPCGRISAIVVTMLGQ